MEENDDVSLDIEYKRYLQIMRPYLGQLIDRNVIEICNAWIQRLSNCKENEKPLRNKLIFSLCYQLARGFLDEPFIKLPPSESNKLPSISEDMNSDESSEVEYVVIDSEEANTKVIYNNKKPILASDTDYLSQDNEIDDEQRKGESKNELNMFQNPDQSGAHKHTVLCYTCPQILNDFKNIEMSEGYEHRANNLITKLREIKKQNMLLHNELIALKEESKTKPDSDSSGEIPLRVDTCTSACVHGNGSNVTLKSLRCKLHEVQESRNDLIQTIATLQEKLDTFEEIKRHDIEDIEANYKLEIIKIKTTTREEIKEIYEKKIDELKRQYEANISEMKNNTSSILHNLTLSKDDIINEKDIIIKSKDAEILRLKNQVEEQKCNLHSVLNKFLDKPHENPSTESIRLKAQQLEKRLSKMEKSKAKCVKAYEAKIAYLQREKHLAECSLQLQLVRQRAQVVNEIADENQGELSSALDKLESKYKEIVGNVQATAIQRRMQDQMALESILQATCGLQRDVYMNSQRTNHSQFSGKPMRNHDREVNQSFESEICSLLRGNKVGNVIVGDKSFGEDSVTDGYCLDGARIGELLEKLYIPQKDTDGALKK